MAAGQTMAQSIRRFVTFSAKVKRLKSVRTIAGGIVSRPGTMVPKRARGLDRVFGLFGKNENAPVVSRPLSWRPPGNRYAPGTVSLSLGYFSTISIIPNKLVDREPSPSRGERPPAYFGEEREECCKCHSIWGRRGAGMGRSDSTRGVLIISEEYWLPLNEEAEGEWDGKGRGRGGR